MTEFELQIQLARTWALEGLDLSIGRQMLVAWEVMAPSWGINDSRGRFNEPSVDFLFMDSQAKLRALEIKPRVSGNRPAVTAALQVSHRALVLRMSYSEDRLRSAHEACWSGRHGRLPPQPEPAGLEERFVDFFGAPRNAGTGEPTIERLVGAASFGDLASETLQLVGAMDRAELRELCVDSVAARGRLGTEANRLLKALDATDRHFDEPIGAVLLPIS